MFALSFQLLSGRYHSTPWGKHVNEGVPEWPPSPWRILRSIISTWKRKVNAEEKDIRELLLNLLEPPVYYLPPATVGHTRHYMPWDKGSKKNWNASRTLIFDSFVAVQKESPIIAVWEDVILEDKSLILMKEIAKNISYLGRTESWCNVEVIKENEIPGILENLEKYSISKPLHKNDNPDFNEELVDVLCADPNIDPELSLDAMDKKGNNIHPLLIRTTYLRNQLKNLNPPMSKWVQYTRPSDCFDLSPVNHQPSIGEETAQVIRFMLDSNALPSITDSLKIADLARNAAISAYGKGHGKSSILSGKDDNGNPLPHQHTFYIPSDEDNDGKLDHITFYASEGYDADHLRSIAKMERLYGRNLKNEIDLLLLGMFKEEQWNGHLDSTPISTSKTWKSFTPFMLTRYPKATHKGQWKLQDIPEDIKIKLPEHPAHYPTKDHLLLEYGILPDMINMQKDGPVSQLLLSIERMELPKPTIIELMPVYENNGTTIQWLSFKRYRKGKHSPASGNPYGFRLTFSEEVKGPVALGYGCHYGLGVFIPDREFR